jgi:hypothetical protein
MIHVGTKVVINSPVRGFVKGATGTVAGLKYDIYGVPLYVVAVDMYNPRSYNDVEFYEHELLPEEAPTLPSGYKLCKCGTITMRETLCCDCIDKANDRYHNKR